MSPVRDNSMSRLGQLVILEARIFIRRSWLHFLGSGDNVDALHRFIAVAVAAPLLAFDHGND